VITSDIAVASMLRKVTAGIVVAIVAVGYTVKRVTVEIIGTKHRPKEF
jgi:hypothetical protein